MTKTEKMDRLRDMLIKTNNGGNLPEVEAQLTRMFTAAFETTKTKQRDKFNRLVNKIKAQQAKDKEHQQTVDKNRWVINTSKKRQLTPGEKSVLEKGLNFAVTPQKIPYKDFIIGVEEACLSINNNATKDSLRAETVKILKKAKTPKSNITVEEQKGMKTLREERTY